MKLCMIGRRGHYGYVLHDLPRVPQVRVEGICAGAEEDDLAPLQTWCAEHGHSPRVFAAWEEMLDAVKPDVVCVDGPFELHAAMCIESFRRGIHVFCEKPVALTMRDLDRLRKTHAKSGVHFAGMMGLRYDPAVYTAWQAVRRGAVGRVRLVDTRKSYKLGSRPAFYRKRETYGGTIPWVGSHALDWIQWFSGERFVSVCALHSTRENRDHGDLEVTAVCQFALTNDVLGTVSIDFLRPDAAPTHGDDRVRAVGTDGVAEAARGEVRLISGDGKGEPTIPATCDRAIFADFVKQIEGKGQCLVSAEETILNTEACLLARKAADTGRVAKFRQRSDKQQSTEERCRRT